jgi:hypothetical protein
MRESAIALPRVEYVHSDGRNASGETCWASPDEGRQLIRTFLTISDSSLRAAIINLVKELSAVRQEALSP